MSHEDKVRHDEVLRAHTLAKYGFEAKGKPVVRYEPTPEEVARKAAARRRAMPEYRPGTTASKLEWRSYIQLREVRQFTVRDLRAALEEFDPDLPVLGWPESMGYSDEYDERNICVLSGLRIAVVTPEIHRSGWTGGFDEARPGDKGSFAALLVSGVEFDEPV